MFKFFKLIAVLVMLVAPFKADAQSPFGSVWYSILNYQNHREVSFTGINFQPNTQIFVSSQIISGGCDSQMNYQYILVGTTTNTGSFVFTDQIKCSATVLYQFLIGYQNVPVNVTTEFTVQTVELNDPNACSVGAKLSVGMTVATTRGLDGWMKPNMDIHANDGKPLSYYETGKVLHIIQGPYCNEIGMWWRVSYRYSFVRDGLTIPTESVSWVQDEVNNSTTLYQLQGSGIELVSYPAFTSVQPTAVSVMSIQGQRMFDNPTLKGARVAALKTGDGAVQVLGQNMNGTFLKVSRADGIVGWICSHLTINDVWAFQVPVVDQTSEECYIQ